MVWNGIIAGYLFLAGVGAGAFSFAMLAGWRAPEARKLKMAGMIVGILAVGIGTLLLVFDAKAGLLNPLRFFLLLSNFGSVMAWGTAILSAFLLVACVQVVIYWRSKKTPKALDWVSIVLTVCVAAYTGVLLSASPAYPLWNFPILPVLFLISAAGTGFAAAEVAGYACDREGLKKAELPSIVGVVLPAVELVVVIVLLAVTANAGGSAAEAGSGTVQGLLTGSWAPLFWVGFVIVGLLIPLATAVKAHRTKEVLTVASLAGWVCLLVGGFVLRYLVVLAALPIVGY